MTQWTKILRSLGFNDSEANTYLASLEIGPSSVQDLAKKAKISRVTTYAVIEAMMKQGLMSTVQKGKKTLYVAESPERLTSFVGSRVKEMEATLREVESSLHELKMIQRGERPVVKMFEGREALKAIEDDVLKTRPKLIDEFVNLDALQSLYPLDERAPFFKELDKIKSRKRIIYASQRERKPDSPITELQRLPEEMRDFFGDVFIYGNKVALSTLRGKQIAVLIESEELAKTLRYLFDYCWHCQAE